MYLLLLNLLDLNGLDHAVMSSISTVLVVIIIIIIIIAIESVRVIAMLLNLHLGCLLLFKEFGEARSNFIGLLTGAPHFNLIQLNERLLFNDW